MATFTARFVNVLMLGFGFMFTFTAFQTMGIIQKTILNGVPGFTDSVAFTSLAIVYAVFSLANWIAPSVISVIGPKWSMVLGAILYLHFIASFLYPRPAWLYVASVLVGLGAAIIWTAQGNYLTIMSEPINMSRNSGIFWAQLQCSLLFGNLFVFFQFKGQEEGVDDKTRNIVVSVLSVVCAVGVVLFILLRPAPKHGYADDGLPREASAEQQALTMVQQAKQAVVDAFRLFLTKDMLLLSVTFFYTGFELSFFSGIYSACIGFTQSIPDSTSLVGMSGMLIGVGEIIGGATFGIFGKATTKYGRDPIILLGFLTHIISFYLIFLNLPDDSVFGNTHAAAYITSNQYLALFCSFTLGFGDACYNTQVYSTLGDLYREQSSAAFAIFKFVQSLSAAINFFYSPYVSLYYQLLILVIFVVLGTVTFFIVEFKSHRNAASAAIANGTSCVAEAEDRPAAEGTYANLPGNKL